MHARREPDLIFSRGDFGGACVLAEPLRRLSWNASVYLHGFDAAAAA